MAGIGDKTRHELASIRDTVESISMAIVLALVLRAFVVEAFVIPTGSMAPRLMGEHWDLVCPACGYEYAFGGPRMAPDQVSQLSRAQRYIPHARGAPIAENPSTTARSSSPPVTACWC